MQRTECTCARRIFTLRQNAPCLAKGMETCYNSKVMNIKTSFAIFMCKFSRFAIRKLGRGGTDMPGRIALKICPDLLGRLAEGVTTVIVTGTNGKTTTSRMIEQAMTDSGISFFANKTGANLLSGVTAEFAANSGTFSGKCRYP